MKPLKRLVRESGNRYVRYLSRQEYRKQTFHHHNERPIEYRFALDCLSASRPKSVLDVGTGTTAWPRMLRDCGFLITAIDNVKDYWESQMINRHWEVLDFDITRPGALKGPFDAVTCISVLEHIEDHETAVRNMLRMLAPGGRLIITTPYNHRDYHPNVYKRPDALYGQDCPYICRSHSEKEVEQWKQLGASLKRRELWQLFSGPVWATGSRADWRKAESVEEAHQLGCFEFEKVQA